MADLLIVHVAHTHDNLLEDLLGFLFGQSVHATLSQIIEQVAAAGEPSHDISVPFVLEMLN